MRESSAKSSACCPRERAPVEGRRGRGVGSDCVGADWKTWRREPCIVVESLAGAACAARATCVDRGKKLDSDPTIVDGRRNNGAGQRSPGGILERAYPAAAPGDDPGRRRRRLLAPDGPRRVAARSPRSTARARSSATSIEAHRGPGRSTWPATRCSRCSTPPPARSTARWRCSAPLAAAEQASPRTAGCGFASACISATSWRRATARVYGDGVNIAARLEGAGRARRRRDFRAGAVGGAASASTPASTTSASTRVKNIAEPVRAYRFHPSASPAASRRRRRRGAAAATAPARPVRRATAPTSRRSPCCRSTT